MNTKTKEPV